MKRLKQAWDALCGKAAPEKRRVILVDEEYVWSMVYELKGVLLPDEQCSAIAALMSERFEEIDEQIMDLLVSCYEEVI